MSFMKGLGVTFQTSCWAHMFPAYECLSSYCVWLFQNIPAHQSLVVCGYCVCYFLGSGAGCDWGVSKLSGTPGQCCWYLNDCLSSLHPACCLYLHSLLLLFCTDNTQTTMSIALPHTTDSNCPASLSLSLLCFTNFSLILYVTTYLS